MLVMPPPKKPKPDDAPKPKPKRAGRAVNIRISNHTEACLEAFISAQRVRPSLTDTVELAVIEFLQREGFWSEPK